MTLLLSWLPPLQAIEFPAQDTKVDLPSLSAPHNATRPDLSVDQNGNIYVAWQDNRNGPETVFFNHRFPEGGWGPHSIAVTTGNPRSQDAEQGNATDPRICSDNNGHVYVVWVDDRAVKAGTGKRDIYLRYSKDYGASWLPEFIDYRIDTDNPTPGESLDPRIACDETGHVYILWRDNRNHPELYDIYFRSIEFTFASPVDTLRPLQFPEVRLNVGEEGKPVAAGTTNTLTPQLTTDKMGNVFAVWEDTRLLAEPEINPGIYLNVSRNHGASWRTPGDIRVDHRPFGFFRSQEPRIAVDNTGRVHIVWLDNSPRGPQKIETAGRPKLFYNRSTNYGNDWRELDTLISNIPKTKEVYDAAISVNNKGGVFVIWTDNSGGELPDGEQTHTQSQTQTGDNKIHIFFNHSENSGATWLDLTERIRLDTGTSSADASHPQVISDTLRNVLVVWEAAQDTSDIYFNFSPDIGKNGTWMEEAIRVENPASRGTSTAVRMESDGKGNIHLVYQDDRNSFGTSDIYYNGLLVDIQTLINGPRFAEACFIATAAYGSPMEPRVLLLREFRDRFLLAHPFSRAFVRLYYRYSPPIARSLDEHPAYKPVVRIILWPAIGIAALCVKTSRMERGIILLLLGTGAAILLSRKYKNFQFPARGSRGL